MVHGGSKLGLKRRPGQQRPQLGPKHTYLLGLLDIMSQVYIPIKKRQLFGATGGPVVTEAALRVLAGEPWSPRPFSFQTPKRGVRMRGTLADIDPLNTGSLLREREVGLRRAPFKGSPEYYLELELCRR